MMKSVFTDIFQSTTVLNRDELTFCEATVPAILDWLSSLPILQLGDTSHALFNAIIELSELQCEETLRFDLIQSLYATINSVIDSLEKHFFNQGLVTTDRNEQIIELALLLRAHFAKIYIDIVFRCSQQLQRQKFSWFALKQKKNILNARTLANYYALQQINHLHYQQNMLYTEAVVGQWLMTHQLYEIAHKNNYHLQNISLLQGSKKGNRSIHQMYSQLILLDILNNNQIRQSEIQALFECSYDWAKMIQILPKETTLCKYCIDSSKDHPPIYNRSQDEHFQPTWFVATQALLEHITATLYRESEYLSQTEKIYLSPPLRFHVQNVLGTTTERRHERYEYSAQLQICLSLLTAHFYMAKAKNFHETIQLDTETKKQTDTKLLYSWDKKDQTQDNTQKQPRLSREAKQIFQIEVLDISVSGYRVKWSGEVPKSLKTGEFILAKESTDAQWRGGAIRWIKQSSEKTLELGLEMLAQDMYPCAVRIHPERAVMHYHPAMLLQNQQLDDAKVTLVLPGSQLFREQQTLHLRLGKDEIKIYLLKAILITQSFTQFDFELLNDQQKDLLDGFMMQQGKDLNNQDLWEALK